MNRFAARVQRLLRGIVAFFVYPRLSSRSRSKRLWAFGYQDNGFAGNSKYLYLWVSLHRPDLQAVWLTSDRELISKLRSHGLRAYRRWSVKGIMRAAKASAFFFDHSASDVNIMLSRGAVLVNLWHGVGVKPIQFNDPNCVISTHAKHRQSAIGRAIFIDYVIDPSIVVSTSPFMRKHFSDQFRIAERRCPELGYPRLDPAKDTTLAKIAADLDNASSTLTASWSRYSEHYAYCPTFRDTGRGFLQSAFPDLEKLSDTLRSRDAVLYIKLHPKSKDEIPQTHDNIIPWPRGVDLYALLGQFDVFISDYSSIIYDYIAVKSTGAITYTFDYGEYTKSDRSLLYNFEEIVPGIWVHDFAGLIAALCDAIALKENKSQTRVRTLFWNERDEAASAMITRYVERLVLTSEDDIQSKGGKLDAARGYGASIKSVARQSGQSFEKVALSAVESGTIKLSSYEARRLAHLQSNAGTTSL